MHPIIIRCGAAMHEWVALPGWGWGGCCCWHCALFSMSVTDEVPRPNTLLCLEMLKTERTCSSRWVSVGGNGEALTPVCSSPSRLQPALILLYGPLTIPGKSWVEKMMSPLCSISCSLVFTQAFCLSVWLRRVFKWKLEPWGQQITFDCSATTTTEVLRSFIQPKDMQAS